MPTREPDVPIAIDDTCSERAHTCAASGVTVPFERALGWAGRGRWDSLKTYVTDGVERRKL